MQRNFRISARWTAALAAGALLLGVGLGIAASERGGGIAVIRGKSPADAAAAALVEAERLAGNGSWELIAVGRVYYLSGNKSRGQAIFDRVTGRKPKPSDWQRIGEVYAEAAENDRAAECFQKALENSPKDDTGQAEIGSWYIRIGQREKGEALLAQALSRAPDEMWHYVRAAEAFLGVPAGR
jgi:tetratricopeptide (TPR) repeat protein